MPALAGSHSVVRLAVLPVRVLMNAWSEQRRQYLSLVGGIVFTLFTSGVSHPHEHNDDEYDDKNNGEFHILRLLLKMQFQYLPEGNCLNLIL